MNLSKNQMFLIFIGVQIVLIMAVIYMIVVMKTYNELIELEPCNLCLREMGVPL